MDETTREVWISACAHQLHLQWRTTDPHDLEDLAASLWADLRLRGLSPAKAVADWLGPVAHSRVPTELDKVRSRSAAQRLI